MPDETSAGEPTPDARPDVALGTIAKEWGRIGCTGFGGPPTHIAMLRRLTVEREHWLDETEFEDAVAATNLLPGPASTQLAIFCVWRLRGWPGALVGGARLIRPGLAVIIAPAAVSWPNPPTGSRAPACRAPARRSHRSPSTQPRPAPASGLLRARSGRRGALVVYGWWRDNGDDRHLLVLVPLGCGLVEVAVSAGVRRPLAERVRRGARRWWRGRTGALTWGALRWERRRSAVAS